MLSHPPPRPAAALGCLALIAACGASDGRRAAEPSDVAEADRYGGTAVVAVSVDQATFNPLWGFPEGMWVHQGVLSMPLVRYDSEMRVQPWLAERWDTSTVAPDTLELTMRLRRDVKWHDGRPTTAHDVEFTWDLMLDTLVAFGGSDYLRRRWYGLEVVDSFTVRFRLRPHAEFLDFWTWYVLVPKHLLEDVPRAELLRHPYGLQPVGNGPFRFARRVRNQEWVFEANPDFPAALGGRPYLDRIVFRIIPEATTRLTELLTGAVDVGFVPPDQVARVRSAGGPRLIEYPQSGWTQIAWNTRRPPFDDARVRRALTLGLDRQDIVEGVLHGQGEPGRWTVTPAHWQYDDTDPETEPRHDPDEARRLLAEAGWQDRNGDGIVEDARGRPLRFSLLSYRESSAHADILPVVQAQLRRIGVDVQPRLLEAGSSWALVQGRLGPAGERVRDYDAYVVYWDVGLSADDSGFLHSGMRNDPFGLTSYANPRADAWMDTLALIPDREVARPLWREYQRMMVKEAPVTVLYYPHSTAAVAPRLQGVEMTVSAPYATARRWWIAPRDRRAG